MEGVADARADRQLRDVAPLASEVLRDTDEVVLTNRHNLDRVGELVVGSTVVRVLRDELLGALHADGNNGRKELNHLDGIVALRVEEVETIALLVDVRAVLVGVVLEDELLEEQEGALVGDLLADLNASLPGVLGGETSTGGALTGLDDEGQDKGLLENGVGENLLLDRDLELDTARVRLRPDELGIDQANLEERFGDLLQTDGCRSAIVGQILMTQGTHQEARETRADRQPRCWAETGSAHSPCRS